MEGYITTRAFAEGEHGAARGGKADRAGLQKASESITEYDLGDFRVNLRAKNTNRFGCWIWLAYARRQSGQVRRGRFCPLQSKSGSDCNYDGA